MEIKPIRDSCTLYLEYAEQDAQELVERLYMQRRHSFIRKCPVCGIEHGNEHELCSMCEHNYNY
jgi:DNA repair exonuclease SbcCD ATPase subunit